MKVVFATTNVGKLTELKALMGDALEVVSAREFSIEVEETESTFEGNALKKAREYARVSGLPALADDSGLCVDVLDGRPGVHSARYGKDDADRNRRLLTELERASNRAARFVCVLALVTPDGREVVERGECPGSIAFAPRGANGFGYDPLFELLSGQTMAELKPQQKSQVSHRGLAFAKMKPHLLAL